MMRSSTLAVLAGLAASSSAQTVTPIDGFETYADDNALRSAWTIDGGGAPLPVFLDDVTVSGGTQAMRVEYDGGVDPFFAIRTRTFGAEPIDLRQFWKLRWDGARSESVSNTTVRLEGDDTGGPGGVSLFRFDTLSQSLSTSFTTQEFNVTQAGGRGVDNLADLNFVIDGNPEFGAGTVLIDNLEFVGLPPMDEMVEDFESYTDDTDLNNSWMVTSTSNGTPNSTNALISTSSGQSLRLNYANGSAPFFSQTAFEFASLQDLSRYATITVNYQPFFDGPPFGNSREGVSVALFNSSDRRVAIVAAQFGTQSPDFEYAPLVLDLTGQSPFRLQEISRIALSIEAVDFGAGTVLFDDITASLNPSFADVDGNGVIDGDDITAFLAFSPLAVIEDFEGFVDTADLNTSVSGVQPNTIVELDPTGGLDGSAALVFTGNNGADPFFSQFTLDIADTPLAGVDNIVVYGRYVSGSNENLRVQALDDNGGNLTDNVLGETAFLPLNSFGQLVIESDFTDQQAFSVRFGFDGLEFGTTSVVVDNIASGDPATDVNRDGRADFFDVLDLLHEAESAD
ncbi:MAG: hypothetical protein AAGB34_11240 [Planctomycetota bacterium]